MDDVCVAFKVHLGWVNAVAVGVDADTPAVLHVERVQLFGSGDREVLEPYHVAGGWAWSGCPSRRTPQP